MSKYYSDPKVSRAKVEEDLADLRHPIENIRITFPKAGYRMLHQCLARDKIKISEYKLRKLMSKFKLNLKKKRRFVRATNSEHGFSIYPNLIKKLKIKQLNQVCVSDIT